MANAKPWMTTDDLIASIKRRISFPISQNSLKYSDLVAFLNEELQLSAVPSVKMEHEEYFIYKQTVDLVNGVSRYEIPNRAIGMTLRDLKYSDTYGNFYDMSRIAPDDKAFFQQSNGSNQTISKYYLEGNEVVLTPLVQSGANGKLNFFIFLRPNALVNNDRAAIIQNFKKDIEVVNNTNIEAGDKIYIGLGNNSPTPDLYIFEAVTVIDPLNPNYQFVIGATNVLTAVNLNTAINAANLSGVSSNVTANIVTVTYNDIYDSFTLIKKENALNPQGFEIDNQNLSINFNQLPSTYTDPETMDVSSLYSVGSLVDFLQTNPGHRTYTYDIPIVAISGTVAKFSVSSLQTYLNNSSGGSLSFFNIKIGDYICLQNECIIPQIPPELHNALAERAASRVLMAIGDVQGYQISQSKLAEMNKYQETLIGSRVEGSISKVFNRYSLLRLGKSRFRRRY
jgi:hypothetical protein